jgi:hypothetical protein
MLESSTRLTWNLIHLGKLDAKLYIDTSFQPLSQDGGEEK